MATLRRAEPADAPALTRLRGLMFDAMGVSSTEQWYARCVEDLRRRLATDSFVAFVVDEDGTAVSAGVGWLEEHLSSPRQLDPRRGHIASMSTDPAYRRRGHARQVFAALMGWFAEREVSRIDLRATGDGQPLYEAFGFHVLGGATMAWTGHGTQTGLH